MIQDSIKQRLKTIEQVIKLHEPLKPHLNYYFQTDPNQEIYKIPTKDLEYFSDIKDADKLEFKTEQECREFLNDNADKIKLLNGYTEQDVYKANIQMLKIVDNSHLESVLYECNRQDIKGA